MADHRLLDALEHERVVDEAAAAPHVRERLAGEAAPGRRAEPEAVAGPAVHGDRPVARAAGARARRRRARRDRRASAGGPPRSPRGCRGAGRSRSPPPLEVLDGILGAHRRSRRRARRTASVRHRASSAPASTPGTIVQGSAPRPRRAAPEPRAAVGEPVVALRRPRVPGRRAGRRVHGALEAPRNASRWRQPARQHHAPGSEMQLKDAFTVTMPATLSAWKARARASHGPGTTSTGDDVAELARDLLREQRRRRARGARRAPGPGGPHTMRSWVAFEPVMWTSSTPGWRTRYSPSSAPP